MKFDELEKEEERLKNGLRLLDKELLIELYLQKRFECALLEACLRSKKED